MGVDATGVVLRADAVAVDLLGLTNSPVGARLDRLPGAPWLDVAPSLSEALRDGQVVSIERRPPSTALSAPGRPLQVVIFPTPSGSGRERALLLLVVTPTGGEASEAWMFYQAFLHSHDAIEVTDRQGILVDVNPAFERIYGYPRAELIGKRPSIVQSSRTPREVIQRLWADLLDPARGRWSGEIVNIDRSGREHTVLLTIDGIKDRGGEVSHFIGVATDISEERSLQLQAVRHERLVSLGQLAAGVAHEINTPLANILLVAESLGRRSKDPWVVERAETIGRQVESAAKIVQGLLDFARSHPPIVAPVDLTAVAHEAIEFLRGKQSADIEVIEHHAVRPLPVEVNRVQFVQVFVNLVNNACDALEGRGELRVESRAVDGWAEVAVIDNGPGIPDSVRPHLFEPFFTTKDESKGTGLGLSICHGIVHAHGGDIAVHSEPGHGATFLVRIPLAGAQPTVET